MPAYLPCYSFICIGTYLSHRSLLSTPANLFRLHESLRFAEALFYTDYRHGTETEATALATGTATALPN